MRLLSYSQISTYQQCPLRYRLQYIDQLPTPERSYFSFGTSLHAAVEFFFTAPLVPPSRDDVLAELERVWLSDGYRSPEEEADHKRQARAIINRFWFIHAASYRPAAATEAPFEIDLGGVGLRGVIDRLDPGADGSLHITDYKTGRYVWDQAEIEANLQLTLYQLAAERVWQQPVKRLTLYHLRTNRPFTTAPRSAAAIERAEQLCFEVATAIDAGKFEPALGRFCPCEFARYCPVFAGECPPLPERAAATEDLPALTTSAA